MSTVADRFLCLLLWALLFVGPTRAADDPLRYSVSLTSQFASEGGTDLALGAGVATAQGYFLDGYAARSDTRAESEALDPRYWSATAGKRFGAWSLALGYSVYDDGLQVETQDFSARLGWLNNRGSVSLVLLKGATDESFELVVANRTIPLTVSTDRTAVGISGDFDVSRLVTLNAGVRRYDYDSPQSPLADRPRLQLLLTNNLFGTQPGLVDLTWNAGVSARLGRSSLSLDFARSRARDDGAESDDLFLSLALPVTTRLSLTVGGGQFSSSGYADINYASAGIRVSGP
ncbi:MAG TPA: porin [Steroidobacteraceae bacterium]|nr:porin [Steroidobacteraceae bacterium]HRX88036.1 porin [Steroidobacteraceae bacterium]